MQFHFGAVIEAEQELVIVVGQFPLLQFPHDLQVAARHVLGGGVRGRFPLARVGSLDEGVL